MNKITESNNNQSNVDGVDAVSAGLTSLRKHNNLQAFQARISERIAQAQAQAQSAQALLSAHITGYHVLLLLDEVNELLSVPEISKVPLAKRWITGLMVARAEVVTVFDLSYCIEQVFTNIPPDWRTNTSMTPKHSDQKCVIVSPTIAPQLAFLAEKISGTVAPDTDGWVCLTDTTAQNDIPTKRPSFVLNAWKDSNQQVHLEISLAILFQSPEFNQLTY
jgi:chemotaxis signal transduction protein